MGKFMGLFTAASSLTVGVQGAAERLQAGMRFLSSPNVNSWRRNCSCGWYAKAEKKGWYYDGWRAVELGAHDERLKVFETEDAKTAFFDSHVQGQTVVHLKGNLSDTSRLNEDVKMVLREYKNKISENPDNRLYFVVDGDKRLEGYARYLGAFLKELPKNLLSQVEVIWVRNLEKMGTTDSEYPAYSTKTYRQNYLVDAELWVHKFGIEVNVMWVSDEIINAEMETSFGILPEMEFKQLERTYEKEKSKYKEGHIKFRKKAKMSLSEIQAAEKNQQLFDPIAKKIDLEDDLLKRCSGKIAKEDKNIKDITFKLKNPTMTSILDFEICSFRNAAKGTAIFRMIEKGLPETQDVIIVSGGEAVFLEITSSYFLQQGTVSHKGKVVFYPSLSKFFVDNIDYNKPVAEGSSAPQETLKIIKERGSPEVEAIFIPVEESSPRSLSAPPALSSSSVAPAPVSSMTTAEDLLQKPYERLLLRKVPGMSSSGSDEQNK